MIYTHQDIFEQNLQPGTILWGCPVKLLNPTKTSVNHIKPQRGMITTTKYEDAHEEMMKMMRNKSNKDCRSNALRSNQMITYYFVPIGKNGPQWPKAVQIYARTYASTEKEINDVYNDIITNEINKLESTVAELRACYLPKLEIE